MTALIKVWIDLTMLFFVIFCFYRMTYVGLVSLMPIRKRRICIYTVNVIYYINLLKEWAYVHSFIYD